MGYNTRYSLEVSPERIEAIRTLRKSSEEACFCLEADGSSGDSGKWYDHEKELREHSKEFPDHVFTLKGEGDDSADLWVKYFKDGKMQVTKAQITYEPFDESKLEPHAKEAFLRS